MRWRLFPAVLASGCSSGATSGLSSSPPTAAVPSVIVDTTGSQEPQAPESCSAEAVRNLADEFLRAYTAGEPGLTERFFAPADEFQWYSEPPGRLKADAYDRSTLDAYLYRRHIEGDELELVEFVFNGYRAEDETSHFGFFALRDGTERLDGKGAVDCRSGSFIVWSLGPNPGPAGS